MSPLVYKSSSISDGSGTMLVLAVGSNSLYGNLEYSINLSNKIEGNEKIQIKEIKDVNFLILEYDGHR